MVDIFLTNNKSSWLEISSIPEELKMYGMENFDKLFNMKPEKRHKIIKKGTGENMEVFRWQKSYLKTPNYDEKDEYFKTHYYMYSSKDDLCNDELPEEYVKFYEYVKSIDERYNNVVINWYNPEDYIDLHRDCQRMLKKDVPIIIVTLMCERDVYRELDIIPYEKNDKSVIALNSNVKVEMRNGSMIKMCGKTQDEFRHGMKASESNEKNMRRISISFRALDDV